MNQRIRRRVEEACAAWLFMAPGAVLVTVCILIPAMAAFALSFTQCSRFFSIHWIGLANYHRVLVDPVSLKAFGNTLSYLVMFVPLNVSIALAIALLLSREFRGMKFIRSIYFVPMAASGVVAISVFRFIFNRDNGPLNALLGTLGFEPVAWLWDAGWAMPSLVLIALWKSTAFFAIILLAALQDVPKELYEAAEVDGAGPVSRFLHVTLPAIGSVVMVVVTLSCIGAFRVFEPMFVLTSGGPSYATHTIALEAYNAAFSKGELGYANAISFVLMLVIVVVTVVLNRFSRRFES